MVNGEYRNSLDDKGRFLIPSRIRNSIKGNILILTRSVDRCIWIFTPDEWEKISQLIMGTSSMFSKRTRSMQRRIIAPAQECEIDKSGRITIPQTLREYANLESKKEATILGVQNYMELWDVNSYNSYLLDSEDDFLDAAEDLDKLLQSNNL
ncbi:MAG: cell division/cell wall cluster transcriptional repressor MraZ [Spirochaetes bacterium]|nr:MAG: cell division/cell wall cluster transcriptional repressor MraZ [Spirochaetota bacterium]